MFYFGHAVETKSNGLLGLVWADGNEFGFHGQLTIGLLCCQLILLVNSLKSVFVLEIVAHRQTHTQ